MFAEEGIGLTPGTPLQSDHGFVCRQPGWFLRTQMNLAYVCLEVVQVVEAGPGHH